MQLSSPNRREVIEDLLDIRIFSAMNNLIKDKIRQKKSNINSLDLKRDNIKDKMNMQKKFITELEDMGKQNIEKNKVNINNLIRETDEYVLTNEELDLEVTGLIEDQEKVTGASEKLLKLNNLKGKISNKVSTLTKEHKLSLIHI